ncbi:fibroblast growth factor receptor [Striga asiatica]|uniref:Fibroblast growth factor receptor n=1 Tax=Striga asiatica TaxID=4170 RepID=A0A5A7P943_STRAF|nr:fibroblast growth factor receptor [Striga asiatica]
MLLIGRRADASEPSLQLCSRVTIGDLWNRTPHRRLGAQTTSHALSQAVHRPRSAPVEGCEVAIVRSVWLGLLSYGGGCRPEIWLRFFLLLHMAKSSASKCCRRLPTPSIEPSSHDPRQPRTVYLGRRCRFWIELCG